MSDFVKDTNVPTKDCISRQAAITIPILPKEHRKYQTMNLDDAYELGWLDCQECIEYLPSAQSEVTEEAVKDYCRKRCLTVMTNDCFYKLTSTRPERKRGKWVERWHENKHVIGDMACSVCGTQMLLDFPKFCPFCGAEMNERQKECVNIVEN